MNLLNLKPKQSLGTDNSRYAVFYEQYKLRSKLQYFKFIKLKEFIHIYKLSY